MASTARQRMTVRAPARGTRPSNRRSLILSAAADLFYRRGYAQVAMSDIADAVAIGPSALYRHFSGKQHLLTEVVLDGMRQVRDAIAESVSEPADGTVHATARRLAATALDHRPIGVLWQREGRHIAADHQAEMRVLLRSAHSWLAGFVQAARHDSEQADLLSRCLLSVVVSISFHHLELPRTTYEKLLSDLLLGVLDAPLPPSPEAAPAVPTSAPAVGLRSRRENLLAVAIRMFAEQGYVAVGIEDIAAEVGIAGPSVYNHFPSKADMLMSAMQRGIETMRMDMNKALSSAPDHGEALHRLLEAYTALFFAHHHLINLLITELDHLPARERTRMRQAQHDYIAEWTHLLQQVHPGLDVVTARIRVQAAMTVVNDIARTPLQRTKPGARESLVAIGSAILGLPPRSTAAV